MRDKERAIELTIFQKYGLTLQQLKVLWVRAGGKCEICGDRLKNRLIEGSEGTTCNIDHCHETGDVRGLLCPDCNIGLGRLKDSVSNMQNAIAFLQRGTTGISNPDNIGLGAVERAAREQADLEAGIERDCNGRIRGGRSGSPRSPRPSRSERVAAIRARRAANN